MDNYKSFNNETMLQGNRKTEFGVFCDEVKETLIKNNRQHKNVRELCRKFETPSILQNTYSSHVHFSPNLRFAVTVPLLDKTIAMVGKLTKETFKTEDMTRVFDGNSRIKKIAFSSDSSLVLIASSEKFAVVSLAGKKRLVIVTTKEIEGAANENAVEEPYFLSSKYNIHAVPYLTEMNLISEDFVYTYLGQGKLLMVDLRGWRQGKEFKHKRITVNIENWDQFLNGRQLENIHMMTPSSLFVMLKDEDMEAYILDMPMEENQLNSGDAALDLEIVERAKLTMDINTKLINLQCSQMQNNKFLLVLPKENLTEEFQQLEWDEEEGFQLNTLMEIQGKIGNYAYSYYGMNYLVLVEVGSFEGKKHKFVRIYKKMGEKYEPISVVDPFGDKVSASMIRTHYCAESNRLVVVLEREDFESLVAFINTPFPHMISAEACISVKETPKPSRVGNTGVEVFDVDCNFEGLNLNFEAPIYSTFQSDLEDFGILTLQDHNSLDWVCLFYPSTMRFFKVLKFKSNQFEKFKLHYAVKVFGEEKILLASRVSANMTEKRELFIVDYNTGSANLVVPTFDSVSIDGRWVFYQDSKMKSVRARDIIKKTELSLGLTAENRRFDMIGGRIICWTRAKSPGANRVFIFSITESGTKIDYQTKNSQDRGTPPIIARKKGMVVLLLKEEMVIIKMKSLKINKIPLPKEIDHGPGADIEATYVTGDERYACFLYKTYTELAIYVMNLQEPIGLSKVQPPENTKDMLVLGSDSRYLMTKDRSYNDEPTVLRFYPLETVKYFDKIDIQVTRPRSLEDANLGYQGRKKHVVTEKSVEFFRLETLRQGGTHQTNLNLSNILVKYSIPYCNLEKYGVEAIFSEAREYFESDSVIKKKGHIDNIIGMIKMLRPQILDLSDLYTTVVYHLDYDYAFEKYLTEVVNIEELVVRDKLLTTFYSNPKIQSGKRIVAALKQYSKENGTLPFADEKGIMDLIMNRDKNLLLDDMTREILKMLIFSPTDVVIDGQLKNDSDNIIEMPPSKPSLLVDHYQANNKMIEHLGKSLMYKEPHKITTYRVHESKIRLDLTNGSPFSLALFEMISRVSDSDILEKYSILIYYKWKKMFKYALIYAFAFWLLNLMTYLYFGLVFEHKWIGVLICTMNILFIAFEAKCLISDPFHYMGEPWNIVDILLHFLSILASLLILSKTDKLGQLTVNWIRVTSVFLLSLRGMTLMRIFTSMRYLIRMLLQVFIDIVPFVITLAWVIFIWAFIWKLGPGLDGNPETEELDWKTSIQTAVGLAYGDVPTTESDDSRLSAIKFLIGLAGFSVIVICLMNFIIGIITETFETVREEKELYDAKELLSFIRDFDSYLLHLSFVKKYEQKRFVCMIKEEAEDSWELLEQSVTDKIQKVEKQIADVNNQVAELQYVMEANHSNLEKKLTVLVRVLDPEGKVNQQVEAESSIVTSPISNPIRKMSRAQGTENVLAG